jgi:SAM-dependent methyltransferase
MPIKARQPRGSVAAHELEHGRLLAAGGAEALWGWGSLAGQRRAKRRGALVAAATQLGPGVQVLELGCGTGLFSAAFAATGAAVTAIDISPDLIKIARKQVKGVKFVCARYEDASFPQPFDAVVGSSVLHHLDIPAALEKSYELLRPGGRMAFAEPNMLNPQVFAERTFMRKRLTYVSPDETAFVRWRLARLLKAHGFEEVRIRPFDWLHPIVPSRLIGLMETLGRVLERVPGVREFSGSLIISCRKPE